MSNIGTKSGSLAIIPPTAKKVEAVVEGGIARIANRIAVTEAKLVMDYKLGDTCLYRGDWVLLRGDSPWQKWAATTYSLIGYEEFALVPEDCILGYRKDNE
jgi:hypothetical protein